MRSALLLAYACSFGCGRVGFDERAPNDGAIGEVVDATPPPPLPGASGWWMADSPANVVTAGTVTLLHDESSGGHDMTPPTQGVEPTLVPSCIGGLPCIDFALGHYLSAATPLPTADEWTVAVVLRVTDCPGAETAMAFCPVLVDGTDVHVEGVWVYQDTKRIGIDANDAPYLPAYGASSLSVSAFSLATITRGAANVYAVYLDGALDGSGTYAAPKSGDRFSHLARPADARADFPFVGAIAEVVVLDHVATDNERTTLETYLRTKYGL